MGESGFHEHIENLWREASDDVRTAYGRDYFDAYLRTPDFATDKDISPVLEAMEDAILSLEPLDQYTMGSGSLLLPMMRLLCPAAVNMDEIRRNNTFYPDATPEVLMPKLDKKKDS